MEITGPPGTGAIGVSHDTNAIRSNVKTATLSRSWRHGATGGQLNAPIVGILLVMREPYISNDFYPSESINANTYLA